LAVEEGSGSFLVRGDFLLGLPQRSLIQYFGRNSVLVVPSDIERICSLCLPMSLTEVYFEFPSRLIRIDAFAFSRCRNLKSICIPASVTEIDGSAFAGIGISSISVEAGSRFFAVRGAPLNMLVNI
jgi:hypothetical protein